MSFKKFDNNRINALIELIKGGDEKAAIEFYNTFDKFINGIVRKYSNKTAIDDDDDLKSYIRIAYYHAALNFNPDKNTQFKNWAYFWVKKIIFSEEQEFRMVKLPINQKVYYDSILDKIKMKEHNNEVYSLTAQEEKIIHSVNNSSVSTFSSFVGGTFSEDISIESAICNKANKSIHSTIIEESNIEKLKYNINVVLANFDTQEKFIIEHTFGLNGKETMSTKELSSLLNISTSTLLTKKNRVIKIMRHKSLTDYLTH